MSATCRSRHGAVSARPRRGVARPRRRRCAAAAAALRYFACETPRVLLINVIDVNAQILLISINMKSPITF